MITLENYEGYLMRYADGELGDDELRQVEAFLAEHPDMAKELEEITAPELRVTAPLVSMPNKKRMLKPAKVPVWRRPITWRIAATVALVLLSGAILRNIFPSNEDGAIIADNTNNVLARSCGENAAEMHEIGERGTENGERSRINNATYRTENEGRRTEDGECSRREHLSVTPHGSVVTGTEDEFLAESAESAEREIEDATILSVKGSQESYKLIAGRMIVVETDGLVEIESLEEPLNNNVIRGSIIENSNLAAYQERSIIGKAYDAIVGLIQRKTSYDEPLLAEN